jgi:hypothetical protein
VPHVLGAVQLGPLTKSARQNRGPSLGVHTGPSRPASRKRRTVEMSATPIWLTRATRTIHGQGRAVAWNQ